MEKLKVLFVCIHNSARSQMSEAYLKHFGKERFATESAGIEPGTLNPFVVKVMKEEGIDISGNETNSAFDFAKEERSYDFVIAVCDKEAAEKCPFYPGRNLRIQWSFPDPSSYSGSDEEKLDYTRKVRDQIKERVKKFVEVIRPDEMFA